MSEWKSIESAPRDGTMVWLKVDGRPDLGQTLMEWSKRRNRWEGMSFAIARSVKTYWNPDAPPPTHWRPSTQKD